MKKWTFIVTTILLGVGFSCNNNTASTSSQEEKTEIQSGSRLSSQSVSAEELKEAAEKRQEERKKEEEERLANLTSMEIHPKTFDFGNIPKETPVTTIFKVKNTGDKPLIVSNTEASCGCTVPRKPEAPILPGEEGEVEVTFTSNPSQAGTAIDKRITVSANIPESSQAVTIKGQVAP